MTKVIPNVTRQIVMPLITENVKQGSTVHTDEFQTYKSFNKEGFGHEEVKHYAKEYVKGEFVSLKLAYFEMPLTGRF